MVRRRDVIVISLFILSQIFTFSLISFGNTVLHVYLNSDRVMTNFFGFFEAPTIFFADMAITIFYSSFFIEVFFTMLFFMILLLINKNKGGKM